MTVREPPRVSHTAPSRAGMRRGILAIAPIMLVVMPFGVSFGVAASSNGLPPWVAMVMSASMMAGGAQFAAIDLWDTASPVAPLTLTVLALNSRHLLFGASIGRWLGGFGALPRFVAIGFISDPSWALTDNAVRNGEDDLGFLLGSGLGLWASWVTGTGIGLVAGEAVGDELGAYGLDTLLLTYFAALLIPLWRGPASIAPWIVAGAVSIWGREILPDGWTVLAAATVGGAIGAIGRDRSGVEAAAT